jgi:NAD(P)-dependent dehydrogenase (short-subunit alcohol dehydrogenase family)
MLKVDLSEKVAIVTGAGQGIGRAIALNLAQDGAKLVINDIVEENAKKVVAEIESKGGDANAILADVSNKNAVDQMVRVTLEQYGKIDILVNNAGISGPMVPVQDLSEEDWDKVINVCSQAVIPHMLEKEYGKIVNISSIAGKEGNANMTAYCAAKSGIIGFTKALAEEVVKKGINVNCICPALIGTELTLGLGEEQIKFLTEKIPIGRLGTPEEVALLVKFLVSDAASFITRQAYSISGGRSKY